jgi:hypothetical protein
MSNIKLCLTASLALVAFIGGERLASAETYQAAIEDADQCEVDGGVFLGPQGWDHYCADSRQLAACEEVSTWLDCSALTADACDAAMGRIYTSCLVIADRTGAVK